MAFLVSPGVQIRETDLTNIIPAVSTSIGGMVGRFEWGPINEVTRISSEADLISTFGYPRISTNEGTNTRADWYTAANFLGYSNNLQVVRVLPDGARNAAANPVEAEGNTIRVEFSFTGVVTTAPINFEFNNAGSGSTVSVGALSSALRTDLNGSNDSDIRVARIDVLELIADALVANGVTSARIDSDDLAIIYDFGSNYEVPNSTVYAGGIRARYFGFNEADANATLGTSAVITNADDFLVSRGELVNGSAYARYPGASGNSIGVAILDAAMTDSEFRNMRIFGDGAGTYAGTGTKGIDLFDTIPGTSVWSLNAGYGNLQDEVHVIIYTTDTRLTGSAFEVLETYAYLSKALDSKTADGAQNYYVDVVNTSSKWAWLLPETGAAVNNSSNNVIGANVGLTQNTSSFELFTGAAVNGQSSAYPAGMRVYSLSGGIDGNDVDDGDYTAGWDLLGDVEQVDVSLLISGEANRSVTVQKYIIDIAERRKDCVAFVSPSYESAVINPTADKIAAFFNNSSTGFNSSSYAVFDSGWKRQYDRYNDEYFWMPLNVDTAGLCARTDQTNDAWWSPAGLNRGFIQNVVKLSYNPDQAGRDTLYTQRVNPVVTFRGQGTILYGDKTALSRPSAFDRINVRRLFIVLEKAIATAAKYQLFEFNDDFTRANFVAAIEPYLQDIRSRRGMTDFRVVCDASNNTPAVVDGNRFVADIYIKPTRSINFITLNFTAVRSGVSFEEVAGA